MDSWTQRRGAIVRRALIVLVIIGFICMNTNVLQTVDSSPSKAEDTLFPSPTVEQPKPIVTKPILPPLPASVMLPHNAGNCLPDFNVTIDDMIRFVENGHAVHDVGTIGIRHVVPGWPFATPPSVLPLIPKEIWLPYCTAMTAFKTTVTGGAQSTFPEIVDGREHPPHPAMSMAGYRRLNNAELLVADAIARGVPGDMIETGVWRGGLSALMTAVVAWLDPTRKVFLADSFKGIPKDSTHAYDREAYTLKILNENSVKAVRESFERLGLLRTGIPQFLVGYFNDTLRPAAERGEFDKGFAVVRLDGDAYISTMQAIEVLYPRLAVGGYVIVDDYMDWPSCRAAITEYRARHHITDAMVPVYHEGDEQTRGVFWKKSS